MYQRSLSRLLFTPSYMSGMVIFFVTMGALGYSAWLYTTSNRILNAYLTGPYGLKTFVGENTVQLSNWSNVILSNPVAYYILLICAAFVVGMAVFTLLQIFGGIVKQSSEIADSFDGKINGKYRLELFERLILRTISITGWAGYLTLFVGWLMPTTVLMLQTAIDQIRVGNITGWLLCVAAALFLFLALHMHIVFLRLVFLRPRLIGGENDIIEAEAKS